MGAYIGFDNPRSYWLSPYAIEPPDLDTYEKIPASHKPCLTNTDTDKLKRIFSIPENIHLYVQKAQHSRTKHLKKFDIHTERKAFILLYDDYYIASPELSFLYAAQVLTFIDLVKFGYELCAAFVYDKTTDDIPERKPVTSLKKLNRFLAKSKSSQGYACALRALKYIRECVRSPREIDLAMLLVLPTRLGGYGISEVQTNIQFKMKDNATKEYRYADIYIPSAKLDIEYHGSNYHPNMEEDRIRENELAAIGIEVIAITNIQIKSLNMMNENARTLYRKMKKKFRVRVQDYLGKQYELRRFLLLS